MSNFVAALVLVAALLLYTQSAKPEEIEIKEIVIVNEKTGEVTYTYSPAEVNLFKQNQSLDRCLKHLEKRIEKLEKENEKENTWSIW